MGSKMFHTEVTNTGRLGVKYNHSDALTIVGYMSPYASRRSDEWLERKLLNLYTAYYYRVLLETKGRFWSDTDKQVLTYAKGGTGDGGKV